MYYTSWDSNLSKKNSWTNTIMKRLQNHEIVDGGHQVYRKVSWSSLYHPNRELYNEPSKEFTKETDDSGLLISKN